MDPHIFAPQSRVLLFFGLRPPRTVVPVIEDLSDLLQAAHGLPGRPMRGARLHATMAPIGPHSSIDEAIMRALAVGDSIRYPAFPVRFDCTGGFAHGNGRYPFVLKGDGRLPHLKDFRHHLASRMKRAGLAVDLNFAPHITLLWTDRLVDEYPIVPIGWTAHEFVLVASLQGESRHILLARWRLQDDVMAIPE